MRKFLIFLILSYFCHCFGDLNLAPISYKGRIRPLQVYADNVFYDFYHAFEASDNDSPIFNAKDSVTIISQLYRDGYEDWKHAPFFWVDTKARKVLQLPSGNQRFSFNTLKQAFQNNLDAIKMIASHFKNDVSKLDKTLIVKNSIVIEEAQSFPWNQLKAGEDISSASYEPKLAESLIKTLQKLALFESFSGIPLENQPGFSFQEGLRADAHFHMLPGRYLKGEWFGLGALVANDRNFTLYKDTSFQNIRSAFLQWNKEHLGQALLKGYEEIAGQPLLKSANNQTYYPTLFQLKLELAYTSWPIIQISILGYLLALFLLLAFPEKKRLKLAGYSCFFVAFLLQLTSLLIRSWILMRPPVSNMFETVIYVPFVSALAAMFLAKKTDSEWPILGSALLSVVLLAIIELSDLNRGLENVQAVLNSNFWLTIHVLMIVGSYGILILAGVLSHFYLISGKPTLEAIAKQLCTEKSMILKPVESSSDAATIHSTRSTPSGLTEENGLKWLQKGDFNGQMSFAITSLERSIVQCLYLGTALLIPGTILGGVWAAQSWGRFWDWDPKESWAFISICTYLIIIHLYRFNRITIKGLSFGAIVGLCIISFTWYGVNYILGTGMHTYGFGSGSHVYYFVFLLAESVFLIYMAQKRAKKFLV